VGHFSRAPKLTSLKAGGLGGWTGEMVAQDTTGLGGHCPMGRLAVVAVGMVLAVKK